MSEEPRGITGLAASISNGLIGALPPAFLFLCVINLAFLGMTLWFVQHQLDQRVGLADKIIERCWQIKP
jgi:hypothetical protein